MKFSVILKLFSVLLCVCMLFVACDNPTNEADSDETASATETSGETGTENNNETDTENETEAEIPDEELLSGITANRDNFFKLFTPSTSAISTAVRPLTKVDKAVLNGNVVIYSTKTIDTKNNVTEKFDVFNTDEGKTVLSVSTTYQNGDYDDFDWDNLIVKEHEEVKSNGDGTYRIEQSQEKMYPSSVLEVTCESCNEIPYILVKSAEITEIDEATREENPDGGVYQIAVKYTYYDIFGTKITESNTKLSVDVYPSWGYSDNVRFGNVIAVFDPETGRMIRSCDENDRQLIAAYDDETDKYGFFFGRSYLGTQYVEIYNKQTGELLDRYYTDENYILGVPFVIHNGDILIQLFNIVEEGDPYDYYYGGNYCTFTTVLYDVSECKADVIDFPYVISSLERGENIAEDLNSQGIAITENVRNIGVVYPIENKLRGDAEALVFDNDMSVLYRIDRIIPEQAFDSEYLELGFKVLKNGDYLVSLNTAIPSVNYAIVKPDGTIRAYLKDTYTLGDDFIYDSATEKIYDYDMNLVLQLGDSDTDYDPYIFDRVIDGTFMLVRESAKYNEYATRYSVKKSGNSYEISALFNGQKVSIESDSSDAYVLVHEEQTLNYVLYNTNMEHILTSENVINVYEGDGYFTLSTYSNVLKQTLIYTVTE